MARAGGRSGWFRAGKAGPWPLGGRRQKHKKISKQGTGGKRVPTLPPCEPMATGGKGYPRARTASPAPFFFGGGCPPICPPPPLYPIGPARGPAQNKALFLFWSSESGPPKRVGPGLLIRLWPLSFQGPFGGGGGA